MNVVLVTEGTYPFHHGGVSVWCDQLVRGLDEHRFEVVAITGSGTEQESWPLPPNITRVTTIPMWGNPPSRRASRRSGAFDANHQRFVDALVRPDEESSGHNFLASLRAMFEYAQGADLSAALLSNTSLARLSNAWHEAARDRRAHTRLRNVGITFADVLTAADLIEHFLRPLSVPPPSADLYHAVSNGLAALAAMTGKWAHGAPFILTEHGIYLRERYLSYLHAPGTHPVKTLLLSFFRLLSSAAYATADLIKPGSNYNHRWELRNGAVADRIYTVYNGIDTAEFTIAQSEPEVPTLSWLGRIDPIKDLHTLIRAFSLVWAELPAARLRLFGSAPAGNEQYLASCQALVGDLQLSGAVSFEGRVAHPADAYHAGSIVLLTSISEGFPYSLIEAMATGKATVSTNVGGVAEAVGQTGLIVPPCDYRAVADACLTLLHDPALRQRLGQAARRRVLEHFTLEQCLSAYRDSYHGLGVQVYRDHEERVEAWWTPGWRAA